MGPLKTGLNKDVLRVQPMPVRILPGLLLTLLVSACVSNDPVTAAAPTGLPATSVSAAPTLTATTAVSASGPSVSPELWRAVLVAGDSSSPAFDNGVETMREQLAGRGVHDISVLSADPVDLAGAKLASAANLRQALEVRRGGACFAFLTSHGDERGFFLRANRALLGPDVLERSLAQGCNAVPTVLIVSACHSGVFINDRTRKPNRVILTAAASERASFGCGADDVYTNYDRCLLQQFGRASTWRELALGTKACVERAERRMGVRASLPQLFVGSQVADLRLPGR